MKSLKFVALVATSVFTMTSFAKSEEDSSKKTKSEMTNPFNKKKYVKEHEKTKVKNAHGTQEVDAVKKTTIDANGHVEKEKVDIEGEATSKGH